MSSLIPHDYRYKISSPTPVDKEPINKAINQQNKKMRVISQKQVFTETSKDRVIESLKRKIKSLEDENKKLKNDNSILLGKLAQR